MKIFAKIIGAVILLTIMFVISTSVGFSIGQIFFDTRGLIGVGGIASEANVMGFIIGVSLFFIVLFFTVTIWIVSIILKKR